jgi:CHAT domain-containing protein
VYAELQRARPRPAPTGQLVAFGDPRYPSVSGDRAEALHDLEARSAVARGVSFIPLPASRREVAAIAALFPGSARTFVGADATEERAKSVADEARYVHFAAHGVLDERFPLNSALALTIPAKPAEGQENGLLQAWEVFDQVRLDADLVALSACETALGKEMGGEGLLGLVRAFHYAGARSVLASLWAVADMSTSDLMKRFYGHLKAGRRQDEALRLAQMEMIRGRPSGARARRVSPYHWAAFQLSGSGR